jgi:hypothetical protein
VGEILKDTNYIIPHVDDIVLQDWNNFPIEDEPNFVNKFQNVISDKQIPKADTTFTPDVFDNTYLHMEIALPRGEGGQEDVQFA